jgi:hypothetical protein
LAAGTVVRPDRLLNITSHDQHGLKLSAVGLLICFDGKSSIYNKLIGHHSTHVICHMIKIAMAFYSLFGSRRSFEVVVSSAFFFKLQQPQL